MPLLDELHKKYEALGFVVLGVNVEEQSDKAKGYLADIPVDFPILFDDKNIASKLYDVVAMPTTVMIDRNGNMRYLHKGYKPGDEVKYKKMAKKLIRE
jgi:thiol-disulfide isomerase/thioredoxin